MLARARLTTANGTTIAWTELGSGEPLVLLHGLADSHRTWRRAAPLLAKRFRVIMPDLPGHGLSSRPDAPYTLDWYAETMSAWMGELGIERAHVGGHSYGGGIAQWMLLDSRRRVDRLALIAAGGLGREVGIGLRLAAFPVLGPVLAPPIMRAGLRLSMRLAPGAFGHPEPEEIDHLAWVNSAPRTGFAFQRTVAGCIDVFGQYMQTWHRVAEIESLPPIALFWGERDAIIPVHHGRAAHARLSGATLACYPKCGHFPHLDASERFAIDLEAFLDDHERAPATLRVISIPVERRRGAVARFFSRIGTRLRRWIRAA